MPQPKLEIFHLRRYVGDLTGDVIVVVVIELIPVVVETENLAFAGVLSGESWRKSEKLKNKLNKFQKAVLFFSYSAINKQDLIS